MAHGEEKTWINTDLKYMLQWGFTGFRYSLLYFTEWTRQFYFFEWSIAEREKIKIESPRSGLIYTPEYIILLKK